MTASQRSASEGRKPDRIEIEFHSAGLAIVSLVGEHDLGRYEHLKDALDTAAERRRNMIVDLTPCAFIDSTTISLLLRAQGEVTSDGGRFALVTPIEPRSAVRRTAELMNLAHLFPVFASLTDALAYTSHDTRVRDLRASYAEPEVYAAQCSCGWRGTQYDGPTARRRAGGDATEHAQTRGARAHSRNRS